MKSITYVSILLSTLIMLTGCDTNKSQDKIKEIAGLQSHQQVNAENEYLETRAAELEKDLSRRHLFYQAVRGTYEGVLQSHSEENFKIRLVLVPSLPLYVPKRLRALEEIIDDLENLYFNIQVVQWNTQDGRGAVGCRVEKVRPDLIRGTLSIASESCPNFYEIQIAPSQEDPGLEKPSTHSIAYQMAHDLAHDITAGKVATVSRLMGEVLPSTNANVYSFSATKLATQLKE